MRSIELRQQRAKLVEDARALLAGDINDEATARFDAMMAEVDKMGGQIERAEKADALARSLAETHQAKVDDGLASSRDHAADIVARDKRIITGLLRNGVSALNDADRAVYMQRFNNALSTGTNTAGGYTIAPDFMRELLIALKAEGGMRAASRTVATDTGASLPWPTMDDRSQVASIVSENSQITEDTELTFGQTSLSAWTYKSGFLLVSLQLLQDSAFDFDSVIRDALVHRFVRGTNAHYTNGTGSGQPQGVTVGATVGVTGASGQTTSIIFDNLISLEHAVDPVYRRNASFMMHDTTLKAIKTLKDSYGRYLWLPGTTTDQPDTILGYKYVINQDMPQMAANAKSVAFGDFSNYIIATCSTCSSSSCASVSQTTCR